MTTAEIFAVLRPVATQDEGPMIRTREERRRLAEARVVKACMASWRWYRKRYPVPLESSRPVQKEAFNACAALASLERAKEKKR